MDMQATPQAERDPCFEWSQKQKSVNLGSLHLKACRHLCCQNPSGLVSRNPAKHISGFGYLNTP